MMRRLFYRGRHHVHTAPRPADGGLVTVSTIAARMRHEARLQAIFGSKARLVDEYRARWEMQRHFGIGA